MRLWRRALVMVAVLLAGCGGGGSGADRPSASVTVTTLSAIEREVEAAYLKSWDVYADAALHLTTARLEETYAEPQLSETRSDIERRRREHRIARFSVDHNYSITLTSPTSAVVHDRYINHSVRLDPTSFQPVESDPNELVIDDYVLRELSNTWKVTERRSLR